MKTPLRALALAFLVATATTASAERLPKGPLVIWESVGVRMTVPSADCKHKTVTLEVEAPRILEAIESNPDKNWDFIGRQLKDFVYFCNLRNYRFSGSLEVVYDGQRLARGSFSKEKREGQGGSRFYTFGNARYDIPFDQFKSTNLPSEKIWLNNNGGYGKLTGISTEELLEFDGGQYYWALAKFPGAEMFGKTTPDGRKLTKELALEIAAEKGFSSAMAELGEKLAAKMRIRSSRSKTGISYDPTLLNPDDRDRLLLHMAKLLHQNHIWGYKLSGTLGQLGFDIKRAQAVINEVGPGATIKHLRAAPTTDRSPTAFEIGRAFAPTLMKDDCNTISALMNGAGAEALIVKIERKGEACVFSYGDKFEGGPRLTLLLDRVFNPVCKGSSGRYTCVFTYNAMCRVEGGPAQDNLFSAMFCAPFKSVRQPVVASLKRLKNGEWEMTGFEQAKP